MHFEMYFSSNTVEERAKGSSVRPANEWEEIGDKKTVNRRFQLIPTTQQALVYIPGSGEEKQVDEMRGGGGGKWKERLTEGQTLQGAGSTCYRLQDYSGLRERPLQCRGWPRSCAWWRWRWGLWGGSTWAETLLGLWEEDRDVNQKGVSNLRAGLKY